MAIVLQIANGEALAGEGWGIGAARGCVKSVSRGRRPRRQSLRVENLGSVFWGPKNLTDLQGFKPRDSVSDQDPTPPIPHPGTRPVITQRPVVTCAWTPDTALSIRLLDRSLFPTMNPILSRQPCSSDGKLCIPCYRQLLQSCILVAHCGTAMPRCSTESVSA